MFTRGKLFVFRTKANAGTRALVPNVWTRKGPTEAGPKFPYSRKMVFRNKAIRDARIGSRKKSPAEAGQSWKKIKMKTQLPRGCFGASVAQTLSKSEKNGQIG